MVFAVFSRFHVSLLKGDIDFFWDVKPTAESFVVGKNTAKPRCGTPSLGLFAYILSWEGEVGRVAWCVFLCYILFVHIYIYISQTLKIWCIYLH